MQQRTPTEGPGAPVAAVRGTPGWVWTPGQQRRLEMVRRLVDLDGRILDDGCGLGYFLEAFGPGTGARIGLEVEHERAARAVERTDGVVRAVGERLPFPDGTFDVVFSNEVVEHVDDDRAYLSEAVRVTRPGGRILLFCPNRWYPVEQHGVFWRGRYHHRNVPLVNYLPLPVRDRLAPHVRTYSARRLRSLMTGLPVRITHYERIFGGYDNIQRRWPRAGRAIKSTLHWAEHTPAAMLGLSHLMVLEVQPAR